MARRGLSEAAKKRVKARHEGFTIWLRRAERLHAQRPHDKGKARQPYEFDVKVSVALTH